MTNKTQTNTPAQLDMLVVGQGVGGMYMLHRARKMGLNVKAIETGDNVGGVWYWNKYPGARVDVLSIDYCYSFSEEIMQEWTWSEKFAAQPEILRYFNFVADKLDLRRDVHFETRATAITYDEARALWLVETDRGLRFEVTYLVMATGPLSIPKGIDIKGVERFRGDIHLSGRWPKEPVNFSGKRVGVIGTGSTGIQIVPVVAQDAEQLYVYQRTPSFTLPMHNAPLDQDYVDQVKAHYPKLRAIARNTPIGGVRPISTRPVFSVTPEEAESLMEEAWQRSGLEFLGLFSDVLVDKEANDVVANFVRRKIAETVKDPETAAALTPHDTPIFARRPCLDTGYYEAYNRDNVHLINCLKTPIEEITENGIRTQDGEIELDIIIGATGYDGLTGSMLALDVIGRDGHKLSDKWAEGATSYLGLMMRGFPNLFVIAGANSPSALANYMLLNEQNADWIGDAVQHMRDTVQTALEPTPEAEAKYMGMIAAIADRLLIAKANNWYVGANIPGKPRFFPLFAGGLNRYSELCAAEAASGYPGFTTEPAQQRTKQSETV
ncbi:flavin-containing monooxygenase [Pseudooceanicola nitratireducens]|uniref:flavin-containing monooxygenase n=1 Tax=Pseudooceanicola nitratireducens TaxID=517719 RepID=UPI0023F02869|nr:NAD(P)/FAD-dependent oxidoreductase [Pseudooceanicola nitratireducens]